MTIGWCFDNTYFKLPKAFKEEIKPIPVKKPELVLFNKTSSGFFTGIGFMSSLKAFDNLK